METEETKLQRYTFVFEIIPALLGDFIPIFIDEAGISLTQQRKCAWIPKGEVLIRDCNSGNSHLTILGAITPERILAYTVIRRWVN